MPNPNSYRISLKRWLADNQCESVTDALDLLGDSTVTALCSEGCEVEPDGDCPHGCPSPLLAMGAI